MPRSKGKKRKSPAKRTAKRTIRSSPTRERIGVEKRRVVSGGGAASLVRSALVTLFEPDSETSTGGKNTRLASLLNGTWNLEAIASIRRFDGAGQSGWQATLEQ
jgi:hypothetical protein